MPGLLSNRTVLLAKIESTYGTDPTPATSANEVEIFDLEVRPVQEIVERKPLRASLSPLKATKSQLMWEFTFTCELKNGGTAGTAGRLSPLLKSCGMTETVTGGVSVTYIPGNPSGSCTVWVYKDGLLIKSQGVRGNVEIIAEAGRIPQARFTMRGLFNTPTDSALVTPTYESTIGQVAASTTTQVSGYSGATRRYSIDLGNSLVNRPSLNSANAMVGVIVGSRNPTGKLLMEAELIATEPIWTEWAADTAVNFTSTFGGTAGNIVTITATGNTQYRAIPLADDNGVFMYDLELGFFSAAGDTELTLTLT